MTSEWITNGVFFDDIHRTLENLLQFLLHRN